MRPRRRKWLAAERVARAGNKPGRIVQAQLAQCVPVFVRPRRHRAGLSEWLRHRWRLAHWNRHDVRWGVDNLGRRGFWREIGVLRHFRFDWRPRDGWRITLTGWRRRYARFARNLRRARRGRTCPDTRAQTMHLLRKNAVDRLASAIRGRAAIMGATRVMGAAAGSAMCRRLVRGYFSPSGGITEAAAPSIV